MKRKRRYTTLQHLATLPPHLKGAYISQMYNNKRITYKEYNVYQKIVKER